jgi:hypothetical protein
LKLGYTHTKFFFYFWRFELFLARLSELEIGKVGLCSIHVRWLKAQAGDEKKRKER